MSENKNLFNTRVTLLAVNELSTKEFNENDIVYVEYKENNGIKKDLGQIKKVYTDAIDVDFGKKFQSKRKEVYFTDLISIEKAEDNCSGKVLVERDIVLKEIEVQKLKMAKIFDKIKESENFNTASGEEIVNILLYEAEQHFNIAKNDIKEHLEVHICENKKEG